jgi:hypothetical protein
MDDSLKRIDIADMHGFMEYKKVQHLAYGKELVPTVNRNSERVRLLPVDAIGKHLSNLGLLLFRLLVQP